jgi:hypothetical protein
VRALEAWQSDTIEAVRAAGVSGVAERVAGELIGAPFLTAVQVAERHDVSPQAAIAALRRLVGLGVLTERRHGRRVSFVANQVVALIGQ